MAAKGARAGLTVIEAEDVTHNVVEPPAGRQVCFEVRQEPFEHLSPRWRRLRGAKQVSVDVGQEEGILIGRATDRDTVDLVEVRGGLGQAGDAAVDDDLK